jgi:hypothetical protein
MKYCFWLMRVIRALVPSLLEAHFGPDLGGIFSPYTWNLEGKLRNLKRPPFRGIGLPFLLLCNHED